MLKDINVFEMKYLLTTILALTCATAFAQSVDCEGIAPKDYLPIICVTLPMVILAFVVAAIAMKIKQKGG